VLAGTLAALMLALGLGLGLAWRPSPGAHPPASPALETDDRIAHARLTACSDARAPAPVLRGRLELRLFRGAEVDAQRLREVESAARRYWEPHGLELHTLGASSQLPYASIFAGTFAELDAHSEDPHALTEHLYARLRGFLAAYALPDQGHINIVVVRDIVHPRAAAAAVLGDLVGLTLAPALLRAGDPDSAAILTAINLGEDFEPTIFLSERHLSQLDADALVAAVAHELGHALGLRHVARTTNLMAEQRQRCLPDLDPAQLEQLRAAL